MNKEHFTLLRFNATIIKNIMVIFFNIVNDETNMLLYVISIIVNIFTIHTQ